LGEGLAKECETMFLEPAPDPAVGASVGGLCISESPRVESLCFNGFFRRSSPFAKKNASIGAVRVVLTIEDENRPYKGNDMAANEGSKVIHHLRRAALLQDGAGLTDAQLLEEYISRREDAAVAVLVRRHGPMVWGVCRRLQR
jgi:hypothetical protein